MNHLDRLVSRPSRSALLLLALVASASALGGCGNATELGNIRRECAAGQPCACEGAGNCEMTCPGGNCNFTCEMLGNCTTDCAGGQCNATCRGAGNCRQRCAGGSCRTTCESAGNCVLECPGGGCSIDCRGTGSCSCTGCS